jgi:SAM-dependent methyltransferase
MIKLNLGSHDVRVQGWLNVDIQNFSAVDIACDIRYLDIRTKADVIRASHVSEHFWPCEIEHVLRNWHERLKPEGLLFVSVPDFDWVVDYYLQHSRTSLVWWESDFDSRVMTEIYGAFFALPGNGAAKYARHRALFNERSLRSLLERVGFKEVCRFKPEEEELMHGFDDAMTLPWSLNMRCHT